MHRPSRIAYLHTFAREVDRFITTSSGSVESNTVMSPSFLYHGVVYWRRHCTHLEDSLTDGENMMLVGFHSQHIWNEINRRDTPDFQRRALHLCFNLLRYRTVDRAVEERYTQTMYQRSMQTFVRMGYDETKRRFAKLRNPS